MPIATALLKHDGPIEPIVFDNHYDHEPLVIENIRFMATAPGQTAIRLKWPTSPAVARCTAILRNLWFESGTAEWANCIEIENGHNVVIENVNGFAGPTGNFQNGIQLLGQCMDVRISNAHFVHPITGVYVGGESEGVSIDAARVLGSIYGVFMVTPVGEAGAWITNSHLAVARAGIVAVNRPQAFYTNNLIYRHEWRAGVDFDAIYLGPGCEDTTVDGLKVHTFGHPGNNVAKVPGLRGITESRIQRIS